MTSPFALYLRDLRLRHGMTQADLAHAVGYEQAHMSSLELGTKNPTDEFLVRLVNELGLSKEDRDELDAEVAASRSRFVLRPDTDSETFRFCSALWQKIDQLHPALIGALHAMITVEDQMKLPSRRFPQRLRRQPPLKGAPM